MTWTTEKPSKPGWYWWRKVGHKPEMLRVSGGYSNMIVSVMLSTRVMSRPIENDDEGEWAGPLEAPKD
jgi:hypothetical protein